MTVITTVPNVSYIAHLKDGESMVINNPSDLPENNHLAHVEEPYIKAQIITKVRLHRTCCRALRIEKRELVSQIYLSSERVGLTFKCL